MLIAWILIVLAESCSSSDGERSDDDGFDENESDEEEFDEDESEGEESDEQTSVEEKLPVDRRLDQWEMPQVKFVEAMMVSST
jgi:hypothetical protein